MWQFIAGHQVLATAIGYFFYSAFCQALPEPDAKSGKFYLFFFKFCHNMAGNWKYAMKMNTNFVDPKS